MPDTLSSVDTAWYRLDTPEDPADIIGVLIFDGQVDFERLRATIEARFLCFDRFRQRIDDSGVGRPIWREMLSFRLDDHLHRTELDEPGDRSALEDKIAAVMNEPLDPDRPLWRVILVDNYRDGDQTNSVIIAQLHHCLGDGFALAKVLLNLADRDKDAPWPSIHEGDVVESADADTKRRWFRDVFVPGAGDFLSHPSKAAALPGQAKKLASAVGRVVGMGFDPSTVLRRQPSGARCVSWSDGIALDDIKRLAHGFEATVNDVLMAALTGAYRHYLVDRGESVERDDIRALVPVNLRPVKRIEDMPDTLGNHFGLVFLTLPVSESTPLGRLQRVKACMDALKQSPEAYVLYQVLSAAGHVPGWLEHKIANLLGRKASTVATNLPGPREPLYLGGQRIRDLMFWAPHPAKLGTNASIISYAGTVRVGVRGDQNVVPDPEKIVRYFDGEFEALAFLTTD